MPPLRESTWHSLREVVLVPRPSRAVALKDELRAPLFYDPDLPEGIAASCFPLALVRSATNIVFDYYCQTVRLINTYNRKQIRFLL